MKKLLIKKNYIFLFIGMMMLLVLIEISTRLQEYSLKLLYSINIHDFLKNNLAGFVVFAFMVTPLFLTELLLPNDEHSKDHKNGLLFWIISIQGNYFFSLLTITIVQYFNIGPLLNLSFKTLSANSFFNPLILNFLLIVFSLLVFDFFYYWYHRMQHTFSFFWEFHKTHHSIKNLNCIVSYHHVTEELFRIPFITLPLAILIHLDAPKLAFLSSFFGVYGQFIHMNSKISLGPVRLFFADNYYHRIHHSVEDAHHNKNFTAFFPIWDILFRTVHFPVSNEFPKVGLPDVEQPKTVKDYFFQPKPFKKKNKMIV